MDLRDRGWRIASPAILFAVNAFITLRLFRIDYTTEMGSIEAAFIGLARYIRDHFPSLDWFPLWYGGIPYPDSYPPLLHFTVAGVSAAAHLSPGLAYHVVTAAIYSLAPVALYWAASELGASRAAAFVSALLYSLISPSCWLVREVRFDTGGWFGPRRLVTLVRYGEGPHLMSLLFLPVAVGLIHVALTRRRPVHYFAAALGVAAVVLSNWIGAFALAVAIAAYLLAFGGWLRTAAIGAFAYALALPFVTPSTIATIRANAPLVGGKFETNTKQRLFAAAFAGGMLLIAWAMKRWKVEPRARFGVLFLFGTAMITLGAYWGGIALLPQPQRYHLEMDLAFCLALGLVGWPRPRVVAALAALLSIPIVLHQHAMAREMEKPIDITTTVEYKVSRWLGTHMEGRRVFAPGTIGFWMNAFSDTPMLNGGFDNGMRNTLLQHMIFQVYAGDKQQIALDWLKAYGCDAIVGGGPESREVYHPYAHPEKFQGLAEVWRDGPEVIYAVPRRGGLAHAVRAGDLVPVDPPAYDSRIAHPYLAALDDPSLPAADFRWLGTSAARITADLRPEHLLSVQVTYDQGWNARVAGETRRIWGDKLGQLVVEPKCSGPCTVDLLYDGGAEMLLARWTSRFAFGGGVLWIILWLKRSGSIKTS